MLKTIAWSLAALAVLVVFAAHVLAERTALPSVSNANFVVTAPTAELAQAVLKQADALRDSLAIEWLGKPLPAGVGSTVIRVQLVQQSDEEQALTWAADRAERLTHMMWLTTTRERALGSSLAHEMTHVVLATRYPGQLPPWSHEGIACRANDAARVRRQEEYFAWCVETGNWPALADVITAEKITANETANYLVATSLVEYLLTVGDRERLLAFAVEGRRGGWDAALRVHYEIDNVRSLERFWRGWVVRQLESHKVEVRR